MTARRYGPFLVGGLLVAIGLAVFVSPLASPDPDGLERVATDQGFAESAETHDLSEAPLAGYGVKDVDDERAGKAVSGLVGVLVTFGVGAVFFGLIRRRAPARPDPPEGG